MKIKILTTNIAINVKPILTSLQARLQLQVHANQTHSQQLFFFSFAAFFGMAIRYGIPRNKTLSSHFKACDESLDYEVPLLSRLRPALFLFSCVRRAVNSAAVVDW